MRKTKLYLRFMRADKNSVRQNEEHRTRGNTDPRRGPSGRVTDSYWPHPRSLCRHDIQFPYWQVMEKTVFRGEIWRVGEPVLEVTTLSVQGCKWPRQSTRPPRQLPPPGAGTPKPPRLWVNTRALNRFEGVLDFFLKRLRTLTWRVHLFSRAS